MNSDEYDQHILQKYRLAVAIAVIKTNPETQSLDQHIINLKNKFNNDNMDDLDFTICSEDFDDDFIDNDVMIIDDASQESFTILKDFNDVAHNDERHSFDKIPAISDVGNEEFQVQLTNSQNEIQSTFCETQPQSDVYMATESLTDIDKTFCDSIARIHKDNIMDIDKTCNSIAKIYEIEHSTNRNSLKNDEKSNKYNDINKTSYVNTIEVNQNEITDLDRTFFEGITQSVSDKGTNPLDIGSAVPKQKTLTAFDSQATELYSLQCLTENFTHVSQSQHENVDVSNKYIKGVSKSNNVQDNILENFNTTDTDFGVHFKDMNLVRKINKNIDEENVTQAVLNSDQNTQVATTIQNSAVKNINEELNQTQSPYFTTMHDSMNVLDQQIKINLHKETNVFEQNTQTQVNTQNDFTENNNIQEAHEHFHNNNTSISQTNNIEHEITKVHEMTKPNNDNSTMQVFDKNDNVSKFNEKEYDSDASEELQTGLVPFKVMEELNRVKVYLRRQEMSVECSLDSGYRSDSQTRTSSQSRGRSALQLSNNWVGQSAYCLYEYLARCPVVGATQGILAEISQVLGQLIDKLHEEETYPSFLEELLDQTGSLIRSVSADDDMVLEKDEKIQRLILLNKSIHTQKYSIEKIADILENLHAHLTNKEEIYELTNIHEIENMSYVFHVLEVILKSYLKNKKNENSQVESQETERHPKRSCISDIWRKKWNPNYKEESKIDNSVEKKCAIKKCSDVLNKIIVSCMDGYSLVAFSALQCFNLLQS